MKKILHGGKAFGLMEHDHGKTHRIYQVSSEKQWVNKILIGETFTPWTVTTKDLDQI